MAGKVISTIEMEDSLIAGEDKNMEIDAKKDKKKVNDDFPVKQIDQSKTVSTRNGKLCAWCVVWNTIQHKKQRLRAWF